MADLCYRLMGEEDLYGLNCGNPSVSRMIDQTYYACLLREARAYCVYLKVEDDQEILVGVYSVSVGTLRLEDAASPLADYYSHEPPTYATVHLNYIAVDLNVQGHGIGTTILAYIVLQARSLYREWPVRLLVLDALRDKVAWYEKRGFAAVYEDDPDPHSTTVKMYLDLMPGEDYQRLSEYVESNS